MDIDIAGLARDWGSWAGAALALAIAMRTHASTSARSVRQLGMWLDEARTEILALRRTVDAQAAEIRRLTERVDVLEGAEERAESIAEELADVRADIAAGGGARGHAATIARPGSVATDVVRLLPPPAPEPKDARGFPWRRREGE